MKCDKCSTPHGQTDVKFEIVIQIVYLTVDVDDVVNDGVCTYFGVSTYSKGQQDRNFGYFNNHCAVLSTARDSAPLMKYDSRKHRDLEKSYINP